MHLDESKGVYVIDQIIASGTKFDESNTTSECYLLAGSDYSLGYSWANGFDRCHSKYVTKEFDLPIPTSSKYVFGGWYDNPEFSGDPVTSVDFGSDNIKTFYAKWTAHVFTIKAVASNNDNTTGAFNSLNEDGTEVTFTDLGRDGNVTSGYVVFQVYCDGEPMIMAPSKFTGASSNGSVMAWYSNYSCVALVKGAGTTVITLTNAEDPAIILSFTVIDDR